MDSCMFCRIGAGLAPSVCVFEDDHTFAFMDALPMTPGHVLVIPKRHVQDLFALDEDLGGPLLKTARRIGQRQREVLGVHGINLINNNGAVADQSQFHIHFHLVPRYGGDRLLHPWERQFGNWAEIKEIGAKLKFE